MGQTLHVRLYWVALKRMSSDYTFYLHVFGRQGVRIGRVDTFPGGGNYPTSLWVPGEVLAEEYAIPLAADAAAPVAASLRVGVYATSSSVYLPATDPRGQVLAHNPVIARVRVAPGQAASYTPVQTLALDFAEQFRLEGYTLQTHGLARGDTLELALYWRALARTLSNYTVFVHLVGPDGQIVDQVDEQPLAGDYPTSYWQSGESIEDIHRLTLSESLPAGAYSLHVGLYLLETNERLPLANGVEPSDYVLIGPLVGEGGK
jgi:hypothetical protein